jgi:hypothetical protein
MPIQKNVTLTIFLPNKAHFVVYGVCVDFSYCERESSVAWYQHVTHGDEESV